MTRGDSSGRSKETSILECMDKAKKMKGIPGTEGCIEPFRIFVGAHGGQRINGFSKNSITVVSNQTNFVTQVHDDGMCQVCP